MKKLYPWFDMRIDAVKEPHQKTFSLFMIWILLDAFFLLLKNFARAKLQRNFMGRAKLQRNILGRSEMVD